jgi:aarF domain-containing kinase
MSLMHDALQIATRIIELCLRELFVLNAMQTDPNFSNFLWDARAREVQLVDFGAARAYPRAFIDAWLRLLQAAVSASGEEDVQACVAASRELGYLTAEGREDEEMVKAHVRSMQLLGTPFRADASTKFDFRGPEWTAIVNEIRSLIPTMLQRRLVPPPRESYSLNRKLSGAFLLAGRLGARVDCRKVWEDVVAGYEFGRGEVEVPGDEEARK